MGKCDMKKSSSEEDFYVLKSQWHAHVDERECWARWWDCTGWCATLPSKARAAIMLTFRKCTMTMHTQAHKLHKHTNWTHKKKWDEEKKEIKRKQKQQPIEKPNEKKKYFEKRVY